MTGSPLRRVRFLTSIAVTSIALVMSAVVAESVSSLEVDPCKVEGAETVCTWTKPGSYEWTLPGGLSSVTVEMYGAQGGTTPGQSRVDPNSHDRKIGPAAKGGKGGYTKAVLGETALNRIARMLQINVGGQGHYGGSGRLSGGSNGGGEAAAYLGYAGSGGGGASDMRQLDIWRGDYSLANRLVVAGGGGGGGQTHFGPASEWALVGGSGGGKNGGDGQKFMENNSWHSSAGGGTQDAGGAGTVGSLWGICKSYPGKFGVGGNAYSCDGLGGGGGGGWFGGGGGTYDGAGGGGSGYVMPDATSSTMESGQREGDGQVVIRFATPPSS